MFDAVVGALVAVTGFERASALAFDGAGVMRFRAAHGLSEHYRRAVDGHSPWTPDTVDAVPILVDDVRLAPDLEALQPVFAAENIRALAFLPLVGGGRLLGKFMLYADRPIVWREVELGFARAAADLLASFLLREAAQERLLQVRKMESLGVLAGGIAHDFNNLLTSVLGYLDLLRGETVRGTPARVYVEELLQTSERAAELTKQLLGFARPQTGQRERVDLGAFLRESEPSLRRLCPPPHTLQIELDPVVPSVFADRGQLQWVVTNLVLHARAAMPDGGPVRIHAGPGRGAASAQFAVVDQGSGLDEARRGRLFEPLFAPQADGHGTGLGLATSYAIVTNLGGDIAVRSAPGRGTAFVVALPAVEAETEGAANERRQQPSAPASAAPSRSTAGATVLLVDDQEFVLRMLARTLVASGYRVLTARNGKEALAVLAGEAVDVVATDAMMPELGGVELVQILQQQRPALPVLLMSGFVDEPLHVPGGISVLHKPFLPRELAHRLQDLLRGRAAPGQTLSGS
jgi:signal transduction histidine kinase/CheY-like chemotaxis protein